MNDRRDKVLSARGGGGAMKARLWRKTSESKLDVSFAWEREILQSWSCELVKLICSLVRFDYSREGCAIVSSLQCTSSVLLYKGLNMGLLGSGRVVCM